MEKISLNLDKRTIVSTALTILLVGALIGWAFSETAQNSAPRAARDVGDANVSGVELALPLGDIGPMLAENGAIDEAAWRKFYAGRPEAQALTTASRKSTVVNGENADAVLNLLWAFGLANENRVLTEGPMMDPKYGGAGGFASTGGWTLAKGDPMRHYAAHPMVMLSESEQDMVERVAQGIYRPCCGNPTHLPDCNHGMAMLGALELLASRGATEEEMYRAGLALNSLWFPDTYATLARYFERNGTSWEKIDPKIALSADYSSAAGYRRVLSEVEPPTRSSGGGCSV